MTATPLTPGNRSDTISILNSRPPLGHKEFSGKFVLRVEPAIHRRLAAKALATGESLNSYCVKALVKA
jgi:predicted HicB family RNase H-like nuclease